MTKTLLNINDIDESAVEEKIANLLIRCKEGFTLEEAEKLAKWAKTNPMKVIFGSKDAIMKEFLNDSCIKVN